MEKLSLDAFREKLIANEKEVLKNLNVITGGNGTFYGDTASEYGWKQLVQ